MNSADQVYSLVANAEGNPVFNETGHVLTLRESDGDVRFMEWAQALTFFPSLRDSLEGRAGLPSSSRDSNKPPQSVEGRCSWGTSDITELISLYKYHLPQFKSTTVKNDKVWQMIADHLPNHTLEQVKNKFKYLKQKYTEKKDNMKSKSSGAAAIKFAYFDLMDSIFGKDANICPVSTASSSRGTHNLVDNIEAEDSDDSLPVDSMSSHKTNLEKPELKKRKRSYLGVQLSNYEENVRSREAAKQKRHEEIMRRQDAALDVMKSIANSFEKISNKTNKP